MGFILKPKAINLALLNPVICFGACMQVRPFRRTDDIADKLFAISIICPLKTQPAIVADKISTAGLWPVSFFPPYERQGACSE